MTDPRVAKLIQIGVAADTAVDVVIAGYDTPAKIRAANEADMLEVLESEDLSALRQVLPEREQ